MRELIQKTREYLDYIEEHYNNVEKAWGIIREKCVDMPFIQDDRVYVSIALAVKNHDKSKMSAEEFVAYRKNFFPIKDEGDPKAGFEAAWEHHKEHNDHHWQNWTKNYVDQPNAAFFLILNIIDWMAMGLKFGDTARDYYEQNKDTIVLPEWAVKLMYEIFDKVYPKVDK